MEITRVGFGAWAIGGADWAASWRAQDDRDSIAATTKRSALSAHFVVRRLEAAA
ncbi:hypothetical protein [Ensifer adhaerens]|uniref:hypothetical protein n=1 Tax=Ensifer adhaerens TaxID=106592 RepID=UPI000AD86648|nr:hypothetical protein [Ensifer adhaerens]